MKSIFVILLSRLLGSTSFFHLKTMNTIFAHIVCLASNVVCQYNPGSVFTHHCISRRLWGLTWWPWSGVWDYYEHIAEAWTRQMIYCIDWLIHWQYYPGNINLHLGHDRWRLKMIGEGWGYQCFVLVLKDFKHCYSGEDILYQKYILEESFTFSI